MFLINFFIFLIGLIIGSFLNCVIYRLEKKENFLKGKSYCPRCKQVLRWYDLIPILSFVILGGKCRYCGKKISIHYPLVELITGLIFVLIFNFSIQGELVWDWQFLLNLCFLFLVSCLLIIIFVYDLKHYIIPDKVVFLLIGIILLYNLILNFKFLIFNLIWAGLVAAGFFLIIFLISKGKWIGFGDVKLAFSMGIFLGFPAILTALFLASFFGAIIGLGLIIFGKKKLKSEIPFGPFLTMGIFIAMLWGRQLLDWYLNLIILK